MLTRSNAQLRPVDEIVDEIELSRRAVVQAEGEKATVVADIATLDERLAAIEVELAAVGSDWKKTGPLFAERRDLRDARVLCQDRETKVEAKFRQAHEDLARVSADRRLAEAKALEGPTREAMQDVRLEIANGLNAGIAAMAEYGRLRVELEQIRGTLAAGGLGVAGEPTTLEVVTSLGCGPLATVQPGRRLEIPVPRCVWI